MYRVLKNCLPFYDTIKYSYFKGIGQKATINDVLI